MRSYSIKNIHSTPSYLMLEISNNNKNKTEKAKKQTKQQTNNNNNNKIDQMDQ